MSVLETSIRAFDPAFFMYSRNRMRLIRRDKTSGCIHSFTSQAEQFSALSPVKNHNRMFTIVPAETVGTMKMNVSKQP